MTPQELDERISLLHTQAQVMFENDFRKSCEQLIRDCIEAVTPERKESPDYYDDRAHYKLCPYSARDLVLEQNETIDTIQANTKELLGPQN